MQFKSAIVAYAEELFAGRKANDGNGDIIHPRHAGSSCATTSAALSPYQLNSRLM